MRFIRAIYVGRDSANRIHGLCAVDRAFGVHTTDTERSTATFCSKACKSDNLAKTTNISSVIRTRKDIQYYGIIGGYESH